MQSKRIWKFFLATGAVVFGFALTHNGLNVDFDASQRAQASRNQGAYDLSELRVLNRAILEVNEHYVDPDRVDLQRMFLAGLNAIQRSVAPVMVHYEDGADELSVQVNDARQTFSAEIGGHWHLTERFREVFRFLQENLDDEDVELQNIEYAAVNGMLRTLDPHTVLLTPDVFEDMQMSTRGEFGGLGIMISIRDGHLTIIRPMPNTPATQAGLERGDRIVKIGDESTLNMPLSEAVDRLRGAPGTSVSIWIRRKNDRGQWGNERRVDLVRASIEIQSVEHRMLDDGIGYISISSFQGRTYELLRRALADLHNDGLRGLVLDLRDNPGGLLDQAVRITDTFLSSGTIVTTSSTDPRQRDEKFATAAGTEPNYPMVVLINGASASASEIVAGALKNHDRAVIIGQRSFGKGSVQVLNNFADGSALKLTIAQYLTPGDVSIQGVGIVPDIGIDPMTVDSEDMDLDVDPEAYLREADLRSHLTSGRVRGAERPSRVMRYYLNHEMRQRLREADPRDQENQQEDEFLTRFSQRILAQASRPGRREMLEDLGGVIDEVGATEMNRAIADLRGLGIDWSEGEDAGPSTVNVEVSTNAQNNRGKAGEAFELRVRVTNTGENPLFRLRATTESDYRLFDDRELVFGRINPGESKEWTATLGVCTGEGRQRSCRLPQDLPNRADAIRINFEELHGHAPATAELRTELEALPRPRFAYSWHVADDQEGNGDGRLQRGERASVYLRVRNVGEGRSYETHANLRNLGGRGVLLREGRFRIDNMEPGQERLVRFGFEVMENFERDRAKLEVSVYDADLRESAVEKFEVPIEAPTGTPSAASGNVTLGNNVSLVAAPVNDAATVARTTAETVLRAEARLGDFLRVRIGEDEVAWVAQSDTRSGGRGDSALRFILANEAPTIAINDAPDAVTRAASIRLQGVARDNGSVRDLYIFAGARKVYYLSAGTPEAAFDAEIPLHGGINYITVFARESDEVVSREMIVVRRDAEDGSLMETPRFDDDVFGSVHE